MAVDLYSQHFGFSERPFSISPDPQFLFWSRIHTRAFSVLEYGLMSRAPLTMVTGEVGTGKTTLLQALLDGMEDDVTVGLVSNAQGDRGDLLRWILGALDVELPEARDHVSLFQHFQSFVISEYAAGRRVVLIIDEAQNLGFEMIEELRMLTNINSGKDELLQIILVGQPELRDLVTRPELRQFAQRVSITFHLQPFDLSDTEAYIRHRLLRAGGSGEEFQPSTIRFIHEESGGVPRQINKLCELALVYAAAANQSKVDLETVQELFRDGIVLRSAPKPLFLTNRIDAPRKAAE